MRRATDAPFAAVFTCPPGAPFEAQVAVTPRQHARIVHTIHTDYLPRIERSGSGMAVARATGTRAFAPLASTPRRALAAELQRHVLRPAGIEGLVVAFFAPARSAPLGWVIVGTSTPVRSALRAIGPPLSGVADAAARTLTTAIELAAGCGARLPAEDVALASLTPRERQVAALVGAGLSDANVAARLGLSEETVGSHLRRIYRKLHVHTRVALVARLSPSAARPVPIGGA